MGYPGPGHSFPDGVVYKTISLAQYVPAGAVPPQYADLEFGYEQVSSTSEPVVTIGGTDAMPTLDYTSGDGTAATLPISNVTATGVEGFQFTDNAGTLWTVLQQPAPDAIMADPVLDQAITYAMANDPSVVSTLETIKGLLDVLTGGNPIVFPNDPLNAPCFARGTRLSTVAGAVAVEDLVEGDHLVLAGGGAAPVRWIGRRRVHVARHVRPETVAPVRVEAGALGAGTPCRTLRMSPDHAVFLDGVLVPVGLLVNGETIVRERIETVEYFHVELAAHAVVLAEGAPVETYLDTGNRSMFANTPIVALRPELTGSAGGSPCAEMVLGGERLEVIRAALPARRLARLVS